MLIKFTGKEWIGCQVKGKNLGYRENIWRNVNKRIGGKVVRTKTQAMIWKIMKQSWRVGRHNETSLIMRININHHARLAQGYTKRLAVLGSVGTLMIYATDLIHWMVSIFNLIIILTPVRLETANYWCNISMSITLLINIVVCWTTGPRKIALGLLAGKFVSEKNKRHSLSNYTDDPKLGFDFFTYFIYKRNYV